jgi:hypothetical protein
MKSGILFRPPRTRRAIRIVAFIARRIGAAIGGRPCLLRRYLIKELLSANIAMTQSNAQRGAHDRGRSERVTAWSYGPIQHQVTRRGYGCLGRKGFFIDGQTGSWRWLSDRGCSSWIIPVGPASVGCSST